jgi:Xaa-Pro aminopeptidase
MYKSRLHRLREDLGTPVLLTDPDSLCYYTGYTTPGKSFVALVVTSDSCELIVRELEVRNWKGVDAEDPNARPADEGGRREADLSETRVTPYAEEGPLDHLVRSLKTARTVWYEGGSPRMKPIDKDQLTILLPDAHFVDVSSYTSNARSCKTVDEVEYVHLAAKMVNEAYAEGLRHVHLGMTENELAGWFNFYKMKAGSEWTAYPEFIAFGPNGCVGHHVPSASNDVLQKDRVVFCEVGASCNRYHAARMHSFFTGVPPDWYLRMEASLRKAVEVGREACVIGATALEVDRAMRSIVESTFEGTDVVYPPFTMQRRSGYSIGIGNTTDWNDCPCFLDPRSPDTLKRGMTLHLIPWVMLEGHGAMGFSDTVVVADVRGLSLFPRPLPSQLPFSVLPHRPTRSMRSPPRDIVNTSSIPPNPLLPACAGHAPTFVKTIASGDPVNIAASFVEAFYQFGGLPSHVFVPSALVEVAERYTPDGSHLTCVETTVDFPRYSKTRLDPSTDTCVDEFVVVGTDWTAYADSMCESMFEQDLSASDTDALAGLLAYNETVRAFDPTEAVLVFCPPK